LTTLRLGAPARRLVEATRDDEIVEAVAAADIPSEPRLVMAGGSNLVIARRRVPRHRDPNPYPGRLSDCELRSRAAGGRGGRARGLSARLRRATRRDLEKATLVLVNRGGASTS
jgi:hypothetical protein